jgi:hypothetical protein
MPSAWVTKSEAGLLSAQQIDVLESKVRSRLGLQIETVRGLSRNLWWPISRQIYADVAKNGKPDRLTFSTETMVLIVASLRPHSPLLASPHYTHSGLLRLGLFYCR